MWNCRGNPFAILGGIGRSAQLGSIIKGGLYLESLATIDTILLDKTGTLTYGTPEVVDLSRGRGSGCFLAGSGGDRGIALRASRGKGDSEEGVKPGNRAEEPEKFDYTPGKGIVAARRQDEIIVGNRLFL